MDGDRRRAADAHLALELAQREAGERRLHQKRGHPLVAAGAVDGGEERDDTGLAAVGHPHLAAVEQVAVALAHGGGGHAGGVGAGAGLRDGQRGGDLAGRQARQVAALLRVGAVGHDRVAGGVLHEVDDGGGGARPGDLLDGAAERQRSQPRATVGLRHVETHEPGLGEVLQRFARIELGLVHLGGQRRHALARDRARQVARLSFFFAQPERIVHRCDYAPT